MDPELEKLLRAYAAQQGYDEHPMSALLGAYGHGAPTPPPAATGAAPNLAQPYDPREATGWSANPDMRASPNMHQPTDAPEAGPYPVEDTTQVLPMERMPGKGHAQVNFGIPASALDTGAGPSWAQSGPIPDVGPIKVSHDDPALVAALQAAGELPPAQPKYGTHDAPSKTGVTPGLADTRTPANAPGGPDITPEQLAAAKAAYAAKQAAQNAPTADDGGDAGATVFGGGQGGGYIPGGFARTSPAEYDADLLAQTEAQKTHAADAEIDKQLALQAYRGHLAERGGELEAERDLAALEQKRQWSAMRDAKAASQAADAAAQAAVIDPKHLFKEMGTGGQVLAILGVALGSVGAGLQQMGGNQGATNQAMAMLNRALDDDMHAQEANMSNKRATAAGALAKLRDQTGDLEAAKMAYKRAGLTYAQNQLDQLGAGAQADELRAGLQAQMDKLDAGLLQYKMQTTAYVAPKVVGGGGALSAADKENKGRLIQFQGKAYAAQNDKSWEELHAQAQNVQAAQNLSAQVQTITADPNWRTSPTASAQMDSLRKQIARAVKKPTGDSSDKDAEALHAMIGDPTAWIADGPAVLQSFVNNQTTQFKDALTIQAAEPVDRGYVPDAQGNLQAVSRLKGQARTGTMPKVEIIK